MRRCRLGVARGPSLAGEAAVPAGGRGRRNRSSDVGDEGCGLEADPLVAAGEGVGSVHGSVAGLAEEGVVGGTEPSCSPPQAVLAGSGRLASDGAGHVSVGNHGGLGVAEPVGNKHSIGDRETDSSHTRTYE